MIRQLYSSCRMIKLEEIAAPPGAGFDLTVQEFAVSTEFLALIWFFHWNDVDQDNPGS